MACARRLPCRTVSDKTIRILPMLEGLAIAFIRSVKSKMTEARRERRRRVLIVEDSAKMRKSLNDVFSIFPQFEVVGEAKDGLEALQAAHVLRPDVITLDIRMPQLSGLEVLRRINRDSCVVIMLTASSDESYKERCRE